MGEQAQRGLSIELHPTLEHPELEVVSGLPSEELARLETGAVPATETPPVVAPQGRVQTRICTIL
jgi:hypothetical protein